MKRNRNEPPLPMLGRDAALSIFIIIHSFILHSFINLFFFILLVDFFLINNNYHHNKTILLYILLDYTIMYEDYSSKK